MVRPHTAGEFLQRGLEIECSRELDLTRLGNEAKVGKFKTFFATDPTVMASIWHDLQTTPFDPVDETTTPEHLLVVCCWLTSCDSEDKLHSSFALPVKQVMRVTLESLTAKVASLRKAKASVRMCFD